MLGLNDQLKRFPKGLDKNYGCLISFFGRACMTFVDKYLLTITGHEAFFRFNEEQTVYETFPLLQLAWQMKKIWLKD